MSLFRKIKLFSTPNYENSGASYTTFETSVNDYVKTLKVDERSPHPDENNLNVVGVEIKISSDSDRVWVMVIRTLKNIVNPV